nr:hypothetical protein [Plantactinospora sp. KBS50]
MSLPGRRLVALLLLTAIPAAVESVALAAVGFPAAQGFAPQATAVWPYDIFHDLRWILVYHDTGWLFLAEYLAVIGLRGVLTAVTVALAWPAEVPRPTLRSLLGRNTAVAAVAVLILSPWAALSVGASVVSLSWYVFASLLPVILLAPFMQRAGVGPGWWRGLPSIELFGWPLLNFWLLTLGGALIWTVPNWLNAPTAALLGVANGLLWRRTVRAAVLPARRIRWRRVPVAPIMIVLTLLAPAAVRDAVMVGLGAQRELQIPIFQQELPDSVDHAVIVVAGYNSSYAGRPAVDPNVEHFSYRGLDAQARPLPYPAAATHRSLESSTDLLAAQVDAAHRRTGRRVALLGQSEGAMVVRLFLERHPGSQVDTVLLFSPLLQAGRAYYPPASEGSGWGFVAGWLIRALFLGTNVVSSTREDPDEPFVRSLLENASFWRSQTLCPVPGVRMVAFMPTASAADAPPGNYAEIPVYQLAGFHGGLLRRGVVHGRLIGFIGGDLLDRPLREFVFLQRLASAWQAPPLAMSVNPAWGDGGRRSPGFGGRVCHQD